MQLEMFADATRDFQARQMPLPDYIAQFLHGLFQNPVKALAQGDILAVVIIALILGIAIGTYSSWFVASPIYVEWENRSPKRFRSQ